MRLQLLFVLPLALFACAAPSEEESDSTTNPLATGTTLPVGADGWTTLAPPSDAHVIHVSSSTGNDANDGLTEATAVRSIAHGRSLLRANQPDWLVFKRGDVWAASIADASHGWTLSGRSATQPMVLASYGVGSRPRFDTTDAAFVSDGGSAIHDLVIMGLHFVAAGRSGPTPTGIYGIYWNRPGQNLLLENAFIEGYRQNVVFQNLHDTNDKVANVTVRRNVIVDAWGTDNPQGMYLAAVSGVLVEENIFDHNGWRPSEGFGRNLLNHNAYIQATSENTIARRNLFLRGSSYGLESKGGKQNDVVDNVFSGNAQGLQYGSSRVGVVPNPEGAHGVISGNAVLHSADLSAANAQGQGIDIGNIAEEGVTASGNIIAHCDSAKPYGHAFYVEANLPHSVVGIKHAVIENNTVVDWPTAVQVVGQNADTLIVRNNVFEDATTRSPAQPIIQLLQGTKTGWTFSGNTEFHAGRTDRWFMVGTMYGSLASFASLAGDTTSTSGRVAFHDAGRDLATYATSIGLADADALYAAVRGQSRWNWNEKLTAGAILGYLREGYRP